MIGSMQPSSSLSACCHKMQSLPVSTAGLCASSDPVVLNCWCLLSCIMRVAAAAAQDDHMRPAVHLQATPTALPTPPLEWGAGLGYPQGCTKLAKCCSTLQPEQKLDGEAVRMHRVLQDDACF